MQERGAQEAATSGPTTRFSVSPSPMSTTTFPSSRPPPQSSSSSQANKLLDDPFVFASGRLTHTGFPPLDHCTAHPDRGRLIQATFAMPYKERETTSSVSSLDENNNAPKMESRNSLPLRPESSTDSSIDQDMGFLDRCRTRSRFILLIMMLLCLTSVWCNILAFNFALICIEDKPFSASEEIYLTSAVAAAALVCNFVVVQLIPRLGVRAVFTFLGLLSALATALMPLAMFRGFGAMIVLRLLQGVAFSANFPCIGEFATKWTYWKQNGLAVSAMVGYVQLAPSISMPISGGLCESPLGWQSVFYGHAIVCAVIFTVFGLLYRNNPAKHPLVGTIELGKVRAGKVAASKKELKQIPYGAILRTPAVWAVWIASVGNFICVNTVFLFSPNYLHVALGMAVADTGITSALPPFLEFLVKVCSGFTSDKLRCISETNRLRLYNTIAFFGNAIIFMVLSFMPAENSQACFILLTVGTGILGLTTGGFFKAGPMVSKQYSQFVTGNVSLGLTLTMIVVPFIVGGLAPNNSVAEWQKVYWVVSGVLIVTNIVFVIFCSAEPAEWTKAGWASSVRSTSRVVPEEETPPTSPSREPDSRRPETEDA